MKDEGNNNYIPSQMNNEKSQNLISPKTKTDFNNIQSLNDLLHKYILQPNSNEFYIKYDSSERWLWCVPFLIGGLIFGFMLSALITGIEDSGILYFFIIIPGFVFFGSIFGFFTQRISLNIFLEEKSIRLVYTLNCCSCHENIEIRNGDVKEFFLEGNNTIKIKYFDIKKIDKIIVSMNFYEDEGHYLVYVLNNHLKKLSYNTSGETPYFTDIINNLFEKFKE